MKLFIEITAGGEMALPDALLRHLGVKPGDQIEVIELPNGCVEFRASQQSKPLDDPFARANADR